MGIQYIRVLKYVVSPGTQRDASHVTLAVTLTSDLGESSHPHALPLICRFTAPQCSHTEGLQWSGLQAVQKYQLTVPHQVVQEKEHLVRISAQGSRKRPLDNEEDKHEYPTFLTNFLGQNYEQDLIVPLEFAHRIGQHFNQSIKRVFRVDSQKVQLLEHTKESIVSHIWDGGLLLSALMASLIPRSSTFDKSKGKSDQHVADPIHKLQSILRETIKSGTKVLELGTGIGLVGVISSHVPGLQITVTDLPTAEDLVLRNVAMASSSSKVLFKALDWTDADAHVDQVDILMMSDVTYNESYHEALASCIKRISRSGNRIIFASKYRHVSERPFIEGLLDRYDVLNRIVFDGTDFHGKHENDEIMIGDVEILVLKV